MLRRLIPRHTPRFVDLDFDYADIVVAEVAYVADMEENKWYPVEL